MSTESVTAASILMTLTGAVTIAVDYIITTKCAFLMLFGRLFFWRRRLEGRQKTVRVSINFNLSKNFRL